MLRPIEAEDLGFQGKVMLWPDRQRGHLQHRVMLLRGEAKESVTLPWDGHSLPPTLSVGLRVMVNDARDASSGFENFCRARDLRPADADSLTAFTDACANFDKLRRLLSHDHLFAWLVFDQPCKTEAETGKMMA